MTDKESAVERAIALTRAAAESTKDSARPDAVAAVHARGQLSARERIDRLLDGGSFVEHGALAQPADTSHRGPADGIIIGVGALKGRPTAVVSYDYSVMAGSQGVVSHAKLDHLLALALRRRLPTVMFCEGAGARAQEMALGNYGRRVMSFAAVARLSGRVPLVGVVTGRCFGGHASMAALSDVIIATRSSCAGIAGPPFVEASTGQRLTPEELGPADLHQATGCVDVLVEDDAEAIERTRHYLDLVAGEAPAQPPARPGDSLRAVVPDNPRRAYDMRKVVAGVVDEGSLLELRPDWAGSVITATVEYLVPPANKSAYYGESDYLLDQPDDTFQSPEMMRTLADGNQLEVTVVEGTWVRTHPIELLAGSGTTAVEFTVTGGLGYTPVTVRGLARPDGWRLEWLQDGSWGPLGQEVEGNDYWQAFDDPDRGGFDLVFNLHNRGTQSYRLIRPEG